MLGILYEFIGFVMDKRINVEEDTKQVTPLSDDEKYVLLAKHVKTLEGRIEMLERKDVNKYL